MSANVPSRELRETWRTRWDNLLSEWRERGLQAAPTCDEWRAAIRLLNAVDALEGENKALRAGLLAHHAINLGGACPTCAAAVQPPPEGPQP